MQGIAYEHKSMQQCIWGSVTKYDQWNRRNRSVVMKMRDKAWGMNLTVEQLSVMIVILKLMFAKRLETGAHNLLRGTSVTTGGML